jgi:hypothetical protein
MKKTIITAAFIFATTSIFFSCKKKDDDTPDYTIASEISSVQDDMDDAHKVSQDAMSSNGQLRTDGVLSGCTSINWDGPNNKITIDFGTGCVGNDGRLRKGQILITYTGHYTTTGTVVTVKTYNYYVDGKKIDGKRVITNNGSNLYTVVDSDTAAASSGFTKITQTDGSITTWKSTRTRLWSAGSTTPLNIYDDELIINGTANGTSSKGVEYAFTATNIKLKAACWAAFIFAPVSGVLALTAPDGTRSLDYGDGECDKKAIYTHTNGKTYNITLK